MLKIDNLTVNADNKEILKNFNLEIPTGEIHVLLGQNGIGKSTICRTLLSSPGYTIKSGNIYYNDIKIDGLDTTSISRLGIQMISQNPIAIEGVTNAEMLRTALSEKENKQIDIFAFNKEMTSICEKLELPKSFIHKNINDGASGGERKKIELLHVWMLKPSFLILDEIDSGLDVDALKIVANSLKEYKEKYNATLLIVTHNTKLLNILKPDKVHVLSDKHIVKTGDYKLALEIEKNGFSMIDELRSI